MPPGASLAACAASLAPVYNTPAACAASTVQALEIFFALVSLESLVSLVSLAQGVFPARKKLAAEGVKEFRIGEIESEIRSPGWNLHRDSRRGPFREDPEALFPFLFTKFCSGKP